MLQHALFARLEAKAGKEEELAKFLQAGLTLAQDETETPLWFALRFSPNVFGIFDAFYNERGRDLHLRGKIAQALIARTEELLASPPSIELIELLGTKIELQK